MVRDHAAVNEKALALVKRLGVTPEANATSADLTAQAAQKHDELARLDGAAFDRAYVPNEAAYHATVNGALQHLLIPSATNGDMKSLLETRLSLFAEHQTQPAHLATSMQ